MEAIESLLMDMLDDGPIDASEVEACVVEHNDQTLVSDMQRMHSMSPFLKQCVLPPRASDVELLKNVHSSVQHSISQHLLFARTLWSGLGVTVGGGLLWLVVSQWSGDTKETLPPVAPPSVTRSVNEAPSVETQPPHTARELTVERAPVSTLGELKSVRDDSELQQERERRTAIAKHAVGADAYRQYRDLFHINLALSDTSEAVSSLRAAHRWAVRLGDVAAAIRCEKELNDLVGSAAR